MFDRFFHSNRNQQLYRPEYLPLALAMAELCRQHGITEQTLRLESEVQWHGQHSMAKRLKQLGPEESKAKARRTNSLISQIQPDG